MPRIKKSDRLLTKLSQSLEQPTVDAPPETGPVQPEPTVSSAAKPAEPECTPGEPSFTAPPLPPLRAPVAVDLVARAAAADEILKRHLPYALGAGVLPLPFFDVAAVSGVQLKLIAELSTLYGVDFSHNLARNVVVALVGGVGAWTMAAGALGSAAKALPGVGTFFGSTTMPLMAGAITYATGRILISHFESGGNLLTFDAPAMRQAFLAKVDEGKAFIRSM